MEIRGLIFVLFTSCIDTSGQVAATKETNRTMAQAVRTKDVANAINDFGCKLLIQMMKEKKNENIVMSPTGVAGLLAMTLLGSVGQTYDEIALTLGFSQDVLLNRRNHEQFGELLKSLASVSSKTVYADAMFVDDETPLRDLYRSYLRHVYGGEVLPIDFMKTEEARNTINSWVKNHTEGNIELFLKRSLPTSTKVVLLSALYFSAQWESPFHQEYTRKLPFKKQDSEVTADLMLNFGGFQYAYYEKHDLQMIALPYNDSETVMYVLKPRTSKASLSELMEKINYDEINDIIDQMVKRKCIIRFPKMELNSETNLEDTLKALGIRSMFTPGEANFALMVNGDALNSTDEQLIQKINGPKQDSSYIKTMLDSLPSPEIHVDSVMHNVKINIDEYGTEAVAATSAVLARSAELFYADSPFYMFIRNERTKLVTFSAVIFDPTV